MKQFESENQILIENIDCINEAAIDAEFDVLIALTESYQKIAELETYADENVLCEYMIIQEANNLVSTNDTNLENNNSSSLSTNDTNLENNNSSSSSTSNKKRVGLIEKIKNFFNAIFRAIVNFFKKIFHIKGIHDIQNLKAPTKMNSEFINIMRKGYNFISKYVNDFPITGDFRTSAPDWLEAALRYGLRIDIRKSYDITNAPEIAVTTKFVKACKEQWGASEFDNSKMKKAAKHVLGPLDDYTWQYTRDSMRFHLLPTLDEGVKKIDEGDFVEYIYIIDPCSLNITLSVNRKHETVEKTKHSYSRTILSKGKGFLNCVQYVKKVETFMDAISNDVILNTKNLNELVIELGKIHVPTQNEIGTVSNGTYYGDMVDAIASIGEKLEKYEKFGNKFKKHIEELGKKNMKETKKSDAPENIKNEIKTSTEESVNALLARSNMMINMIKDVAGICNSYLEAIDALKAISLFYAMCSTPEFQRGVVDGKSFRDQLYNFAHNKINEPNTTTNLQRTPGASLA